MAEAKIKLVLDGAHAVTTGLKQVGDRVGDLTNSLGALTAVGGSLSLGAFSAMIKSSIDAADELGDLSKSTSITVETLSGLKLAAEQSGADLDSVAKAVNKLSVNMGKDAEKFAQIGVTAKEPIEALKQLADVLATIDDPQTRAAVAAEALGKSWEGVAPLLAEGGTRIGEMVRKGQELSGVTQGMVDRADEFNDKLAELSAGLSGTKMVMANEMLPTLIQFVSELNEGIRIAGGFTSAIMTFGFSSPFGTAAEQAKKYREELADLEEQRSRILRSGSPDTSGVDQAIAKTKQLLEFAKFRERAAADFSGDNQFDAEAQRLGLIASKAAPKGIGNFLGGKKDGAADSDYQKLIRSIREKIELEKAEAASAAQLTTGEQLQVKIKADLEGGTIKLTAAEQQRINSLLGTLVAEEKSNEVKKLAAKSTLEAAQAHAKFLDSLAAGLEKMQADTLAQQEYIDRLGLTRTQIAALDAAKLEEQAVTLDGIAIKKLDRDLDETQYNLYKAQANELRKLAGLKRQGASKEDFLDEQKRLAEESERVWRNFTENVQRNLGDELYNAMQGKFDSIGDAFKAMLMRMAADAAAARITDSIFGGGSYLNVLGSAMTGGWGSWGTMNAGVASSQGLSLVDLAGAFADGGDPPVGEMSLVGERGPELFVPKQAGTIVPNHKLGNFGGTSVSINQNIRIDGQMDRQAVQRDMMRVKEMTVAEVMEKIRIRNEF